MNMKIILTNYLLTYMYGDRVFCDPFLLSREVLKKAYHEGIYFISSEKNIDSIMNEPEKVRNLFVFAGIPNFIEVCTELFPKETLNALKMNISYEELGYFTYDEKKRYLRKDKVKIDSFEKIKLKLFHKKGELYYGVTLDDSQLSLTEAEKEIVIKKMVQELEGYHYEILKQIDFLREKLFTFLNSKESEKILEDENLLKAVKESVEELVPIK